MRVIVTMICDSGKRGRIAMDSNQTVRVGRQVWADFAVPDDPFLSGVHFQLRTDAVACYVRDEGSRHGTLVNGQRVMETVLRDGDAIQAGETRFLISIEGDQPDQAQAVASCPLPPVTGGGTRDDALFTMLPAASGLYRFSGRADGMAPAELAALLDRTVPLVLIVDFHRVAVAPPTPGAPQYLYDWLDPLVRARMSPVLVDASAYDQWPRVVEEGWGNNAVICCHTRLAFPDFAAGLRNLTRVAGQASGQSDSDAARVLGLGWPDVLTAILDSRAAEIVAVWSELVEFTLLENPRDPETWTLFGPPSLNATLQQLGLTAAEAEPSARDTE